MNSPPSLLVAVLAVAVLAGCAPDKPIVLPAPSPTSAPIFESDEEALAAAEVAYGEYLKVSNEITADGGERPERIHGLVSAELEEQAHEDADAYLDAGKRTTGYFRFDTVSLQQYSDLYDGNADVLMYACVDVSDYRIIAADGSDVTPKDRDERLPIQVGFRVTSPPTKFVVESNDYWSGDDFCSG